MTKFAPPPTKFGPSQTGQPKAAANLGPARPHAPPPTRFGQGATAQAKPQGQPTNHAPPPTRFGTAPVQPKAAAPAPVRAIHRPPPNPDTAGAIQPYHVLGPGKLYGAIPAQRPWFGYPYAVVTGAQLPAQERRAGVAGEAAFLSAHNVNAAHIQPHGGGMSLRVSDDNQMAIEDSDLSNRQPKRFFLTTALRVAANLDLQAAGSAVRLNSTGHTITILTGWSTQVTLTSVTPRYVGQVDANQLPQNCNNMAEEVSGIPHITRRGDDRALDVSQQLSGAVGGLMSEAQVRGYVRSYSNAASRWSRTLGRMHLNQFANPGIGESYMIWTIMPSSRRQIVEEELYDLNQRRDQLWRWERRRMTNLQEELDNLPPDAPLGPVVNVMDYESGVNRPLGWRDHFGGVVAKSGSDVVTLENYARGDGREANPDPRWYFQMYGQAKSGQSFHEAHKAQNAYSNPLTVTVRR